MRYFHMATCVVKLPNLDFLFGRITIIGIITVDTNNNLQMFLSVKVKDRGMERCSCHGGLASLMRK